MSDNGTKDEICVTEIFKEMLSEMKEININFAKASEKIVENENKIRKIEVIQDNCPVINTQKVFRYLGIKLAFVTLIGGLFGAGAFYVLKQLFGG